MEYQKTINFLENAPNQPNKFRTKNWAKINDDWRGKYNTNSHIKFKTSSLSDYADAYILVKGSITIDRVAARAQPQIAGKKVIFKTFAPFTNCISV